MYAGELCNGAVVAWLACTDIESKLIIEWPGQRGGGLRSQSFL